MIQTNPLPCLSLEANRVRRFQVLNGYFDAVSKTQAVDWSMNQIRLDRLSYICTVNVAILMMMRSQLSLRKFIDKASLIVADGQPIVWVSRWLGTPLPERVTGIDLIDAIAARAEQEGIGIYLLGATPHVIERSAQALQQKYPDLRIDYSDGYFSPDRVDEKVLAINQSGAKILFIGMGVPRQEHFIKQNLAHLNVKLAMGVGGSFDVISGLRKRAPLWIQKAGLEWLYRLLQEPQRLGKRYVTTNLRFMLETFKVLTHRWVSLLLSTV